MSLSDKQKEYLANCDHRWNLKVGATGSGKSWIDYTKVIPERILRCRGMGAIVLFGNTQGTLSRNILEPMRDIWGEKLVSRIHGNNCATIFGKECYILGADTKTHVARIQGMTIEYAYGDEMTTWNEDVFQMLKSRLRTPHSYFDGTMNPTDPMHFMKEFIDSDADIYCQTTTIDDNPFLPDDFVENLKKEYAGTVYYPRFIEGLWTKAEGLIYPRYEEALEEPFTAEFEEYGMSIDYGTKNAFAALLFGRKGDTWHLFREYRYSGRDTGRDKTDDDYVGDMISYTDDLPDWVFTDGGLLTYVDPSAASFITALRRASEKKIGQLQYRRFRVLHANNDVENGIRETAVCLVNGRVKIFRSLKEIQKEFLGYVWDEKEDRDVPVKVNDHEMDALRYFIKTKNLIRPVQAAGKSLFGG